MVEDPHVCDGFLLISGLLLLTVNRLIHTEVTNISYKVILLYNTFIHIQSSLSFSLIKRCFWNTKDMFYKD